MLAGSLLAYCCGTWIFGVTETTRSCGVILIFYLRDRCLERPNAFNRTSSDDNDDVALYLLPVGTMAVGCRSRMLFFYGFCRLRLSPWVVILFVLEHFRNFRREVT